MTVWSLGKLNPFLGSVKVTNAYLACDREIANMADKIQ